MLNRREVLTNPKSWLKRPTQRKPLKEVTTEVAAHSRALLSEKYLGQESPETGPTGIFIFSDNLKLYIYNAGNSLNY